MTGKQTVFCTLNWAILKWGLSSHGRGSCGRGFLSTKSGPLEPIASVEDVRTGVLPAYLAFLDGDHIWETTQHSGTICKQRHFWLITEMTSTGDWWSHAHNHLRELTFLFSFLLLTIVLYRFLICKIRKWCSDLGCYPSSYRYFVCVGTSICT